MPKPKKSLFVNNFLTLSIISLHFKVSKRTNWYLQSRSTFVVLDDTQVDPFGIGRSEVKGRPVAGPDQAICAEAVDHMLGEGDNPVGSHAGREDREFAGKPNSI